MFTKRSLLAAAVLALVAAASAPAQTSSKSVVSVDAAGPDAPVAAGSSFDASVTMHIKAGYHTNAQKPSEDYLIGTSLKLSPPAGVTVTKTGYPAAQFHKFSFSENPLAVYEGTAKISITMKVDAKTAAGPLTVPGKLTFQACNDSQCLPPSTVDVNIAVEVTAAAAAEDAGTQTLTVAGAPPDAQVLIDGKPVGRANAMGRFVAKDLKPGRYRVRVEHEGFQAWDQPVTVATAPQTVNVALVADPTAPPPTAAAPVPAAETPAPTPTPQPAPAAAQPAAESGGSNAILYTLVAAVVAALVGLGVYTATRSKGRAA
jgi:hypothetical protein